MKYDDVNKTIGKSFADKLEEIIIESGSMIYSKRSFVEFLGCANFTAGARLQKALKRLGIDTPKKLYQMDPFSIVRVKGIGEAAMYVAMCILDANGYDAVEWWGYNDNTVKFSSFKHNAIRRARKAKHE